MNTGVEGSLLAGFLNALIDERNRFAVHFFNARGMDTPIRNQILHSHAADLAANGIEARNGHAFRSVIDNEVGAVSCSKERMFRPSRPMMRPFKSSEGIWMVETVFSAEWSAATRWIARLRIIRAFYQLRFRSHLRIANDGSGFVRDLIAQRVEKLLFSLLGCHARNTLELAAHLHLSGGKVSFASLDLTLHGRKLMLASIEGLDPTIKGLFALSNAAFSHAHFAHTLLVLLVDLLLVAQSLIFASMSASRRMVSACFFAFATKVSAS